MAANVETMFYVKEKPWHGLGERVEEALTSAEALKKAGLDWDVIPKPIFTEGPKVQIPGFVANVRSSDSSVLGVVSDRYTVCQNRDAFSFTDALIGEGCRYETAGSLQNGRKVWMLAKLPHNVKILGDLFEPYLLFSNSHDATGAIRVAATPVRVVCQNTLNLALGSTKRSWSACHRGDVEGKLHEARLTLSNAKSYFARLAEQADVLSQFLLSRGQVEEMLEAMFPVTESTSKREATNKEACKEEILTLYKADDLKKFEGTAYAFVNAVADWADHRQPLRATPSFREVNFGKVVDGHPVLDMAHTLVTSMMKAA